MAFFLQNYSDSYSPLTPVSRGNVPQTHISDMLVDMEPVFVIRVVCCWEIILKEIASLLKQEKECYFVKLFFLNIKLAIITYIYISSNIKTLLKTLLTSNNKIYCKTAKHV